VQLSEDRTNHLAHRILKRLKALAGMPAEDQALREIKRRMKSVLQEDDVIDRIVRDKIASLKRGVPVGTGEWEILYRKYYEEEAARRRR
jgi:hypothetical protein